MRTRPRAKAGGARARRSPTRYWVRTVTTPPGLFARPAPTIARVLASKKVSPKGPTSGLRMLLFYINRAGRQLGQRQRRELLKAKRSLQEMIAEGRRSG